ncbi:B12-binding domain-containing radical SAM protein [Rhizobium leguminosarum]|uniref:B12-binding domain-containing radical SAM protein n=1 Tax=Rhizobium leguminosarum TaxID=384 RepID=UPI0013F17A39|nr:radical SAM protein [Rhizobium leguminosarum]
MRFLLFQTTLERVEESFHDTINAGYPLGLAYIHAYAVAAGHAGESHDLTNTGFDECRSFILDRIAVTKPDLVGFQVLSSNRVSTFDMVETLKELHPGLPVVLGGIHASVRHFEILARGGDFGIIVGEAEAAFSQLLDNIRLGRSLYSDVKGIAYNDHGKTVHVAAGPAVDLDTLPFPAHDQFLTGDSTYASLITSRGCPFACSFCSVARRPMRMRSVAGVVDEMEMLVARFPQIKAIRIWDDQFFFDNDRVIAICDEIVRRGIKMSFICLGRLKPCSREMVLAMERAGFVHVLFGLETGSRAVALKANKKIKLDWALETAALFADSRINISMFLIVGLEGETADTVAETAEFVQKIQAVKYFPCWWNVGIATVYPDTDLFGAAVRRGMMTEGYWETANEVPLFTAENSFDQLHDWKERLLDHIDPLKMLESRTAFLAQRDLIPSILVWTLRNFASVGDPYVDDSMLSPVLDLIAEAVASPTSGIQLRVDRSIGDDPSGGGYSLVERLAGSENVYRVRRQKASGRGLFAGLMLTACQSGNGTFLGLLARAVETLIEQRLGKSNALPAQGAPHVVA